MTFLGFLLIAALAAAFWIVYGRGAVIVYKHKRDEGIELAPEFDKEQIMDALKKNLDYKDAKQIYFDEHGTICIDGRYGTYYARIINNHLCIDGAHIEEDDLSTMSKKSLSYWIALYGKGLFNRGYAKQLEEIECIRAYIVKLDDPDADINARKKYVDMDKAHKLSNRTRFVFIALIAAAVIVFASNIATKVVTSQVTESHLTGYSTTVTVGDAFENYFDNPKWSWKIKDSTTYVVFDGVFLYDGERTDAKIVFEIADDGSSCTIDRIEIDGKENNLLGLFLLADVFS